MSYYSPLQSFLLLIAPGVVGVISWFMRRDHEKRSSWPTWLFVPVAVLMALPLGAESKPPDPLHFFYLAVFALVLVRWVVAVAFRERSRGWIFYILAFVAVTFSARPVFEALIYR